MTEKSSTTSAFTFGSLNDSKKQRVWECIPINFKNELTNDEIENYKNTFNIAFNRNHIVLAKEIFDILFTYDNVNEIICKFKLACKNDNIDLARKYEKITYRFYLNIEEDEIIYYGFNDHHTKKRKRKEKLIN